eukprot:247541_1
MLRRSLFRQTQILRHSGCKTFATAQPAILDRNMGSNQWYVHLSRESGADLNTIKKAINQLRSDCDREKINLVLGFGPSLLQDLTKDIPNDFESYPGYASKDGKVAKATQEELLIWINQDSKDKCWKAQYDARIALEGTMKVARETMTFIYANSLDLTGFIDGTGNPEEERDTEVAIVPDGEKGAGGSFIIAQRWVHDLKYFNSLALNEQEGLFGRTKKDSTRLDKQPQHSHISHVELRDGKTGDESKIKRDEMSRRSTPYAFHDGTVGLYFMGFCKTQAPLRERMEAIYGQNGQVRDALTDYSTPASGSFYFAPSVEMLNSL